MPAFRNVKIDVIPHNGTGNVEGFRVYVRAVPQSAIATNWGGYVAIGVTDRSNSIIWDKAIAGNTYEFQIRALDSSRAEIHEEGLIKRFHVDPDPPTSVTGIEAELDE